ncbi:hypothetical protein GJAV_G00126870 [Gymnothorax javanicus]|nr:hypothetical protein GJAV_G00126870 [Gymnothorax javanicus]
MAMEHMKLTDDKGTLSFLVPKEIRMKMLSDQNYCLSMMEQARRMTPKQEAPASCAKTSTNPQPLLALKPTDTPPRPASSSSIPAPQTQPPVAVNLTVIQPPPASSTNTTTPHTQPPVALNLTVFQPPQASSTKAPSFTLTPVAPSPKIITQPLPAPPTMSPSSPRPLVSPSPKIIIPALPESPSKTPTSPRRPVSPAPATLLTTSAVAQPPTPQPGSLETPSTSDFQEHHHGMTRRTTQLLLSLVQSNMTLYTDSKVLFYKKVSREFQKHGHNFPIIRIRKKLNNMLTTYKRAKNRCRSMGEDHVTWKYYDQMDEIFGSRGVGSAPSRSVASSRLFSTAIPEPAPAAASEEPVMPATSLDASEAHGDVETAVLESLVSPDLERWRRLKEKRRRTFEKKMLGRMGQISDVLKEITKQNEKIISLLQRNCEK